MIKPIMANSAMLYFEAFGSFHPGLNSAGTKKSFYIFLCYTPPTTTKMARVKIGVKVTGHRSILNALT